MNGKQYEGRPERVRIYRPRPVQVWTRPSGHFNPVNGEERKEAYYFEYAYKEFDTVTGELVATGSEDFSAERVRFERLDWVDVWVWDGERRNRGGYRWFERVGWVRVRMKDRAKVRRYFATKYHAAAVDLR